MAKKAKKAKAAKKSGGKKSAAKKRAAAPRPAPPPPPPMHRTCGTMEVHHRMMEAHPEYRVALGRLELATQARILARAAMPTTRVTIPVVVHVVFNTREENISDQQVKSEIDSLN